MSQSDILEILEGSSIPLSAKEIADMIGKNSETELKKTYKLLKKLLEHEEIKYIEIDRLLAMKFFKTYRRMRLYYL